MRDPYEPFAGETQDTTGFTAQDLDGRTVEEQRAAAIAECTLCDPDGYRTGGTRCTHEDHAAAAARHRAEIQAELDKIAARKQPPTDTPERSS